MVVGVRPRKASWKLSQKGIFPVFVSQHSPPAPAFPEKGSEETQPSPDTTSRGVSGSRSHFWKS